MMFLLKFWPYILAAVAFFAVLSYIGILKAEVSHYKKEAMNYEQEYEHLVESQKAEALSIAAKAKQQDAVRAESGKQASRTIFELQNQHLKDIHELAELRNISIPEPARRVFNDTPESGPNPKDSSGAPNGSDAKASATLDDDLKDRNKQVTLADLLVANETNKANYLQCAKDKQDWIVLWKETELNLNGN